MRDHAPLPFRRAALAPWNRRDWRRATGALGLAAALPASAGAPAPRTGDFDFARTEDHLAAWLKIYGDLAGNVDTYSWFGGEIFAVVGDHRPPVPLLGWEGFAVNRIVAQEDGSFEETPFRLPLFVQEDDAFVAIEFNDVRDNALRPEQWPRESSGTKVRVSESMQFMTRHADLQNPALTRCETTVAWTLLRGWLPWMLMGPAPRQSR
jgi:hypothetical protein